MLHPQPLGAKCIIPTRSLILTPFPKHIKTFVYHFLLFRARSEMHKAPNKEEDLRNTLSDFTQNIVNFAPLFATKLTSHF